MTSPGILLPQGGNARPNCDTAIAPVRRTGIPYRAVATVRRLIGRIRLSYCHGPPDARGKADGAVKTSPYPGRA